MILSFTYLEAQVQVKKDKVTFDKKEVAKVESPFRNRWVYSDLQGNKKFTVDFKGVSANEANMFQWLEVTSADGNQVSEIPYEVLVTSFKVDRIVSHLLSVKYGVIDNSGINEPALAKLFEQNTEKLSDKYTTAVVVAKEQEADRKNKEVEIRNTYYPQVKSDKSITFTQVGKVRIVGRLSTKPYQVATIDDYIHVFDLDGNTVATMSSTNTLKEYKVRTWDDNVYTYLANRTYADDNNAFLQEFVIDLVSRGYMLEHQIKRESAELHKAKVDMALERSINLYDVNGYVVDKEGIKYNGKITMWFEMLDVNETGQKLPEYGADGYGQNVTVLYINDKGKSREKTFNAKDDNYFCVQGTEAENCYYGLKTYGEAMKKLQNLDSFKFNNAYYYLLLKKEKGIMLLQDPVEMQKYVIKIDSDEKGQMIDNRSEEKLAEKLGDYLIKCPELSKEIKSGAIDIKSENNLFQIVEEYSQCKK